MERDQEELLTCVPARAVLQFRLSCASASFSSSLHQHEAPRLPEGWNKCTHARRHTHTQKPRGSEQITSSHPDSSCKQGRAQSGARDDCEWKPCHFNYTHGSREEAGAQMKRQRQQSKKWKHRKREMKVRAQHPETREGRECGRKAEKETASPLLLLESLVHVG